MSYEGKRGAGERVLEGRHVIGLFLAVILLSGLFFTLGYVMGLHQSEARASADDLPNPASRNAPKPETVAKRAQKTTPGESSTDTGTGTPNSSEWEFYHAGEKNKNEDLLKPGAAVPATRAKSDSVLVKSPAPRGANAGGLKASKGSTVSAAPANGYSLQVAAMNREADALDLANVLQKKKFPAYVLSPHGDNYYRVQVGPYADLKATDAARKGLEAAGFKAFVKH